MASAANVSGELRRAKMRLPSWLYGNNVLGFAKTAQLDLEPVNVVDGWWSATTTERREHRAAGLVSLHRIPEGALDDSAQIEGILSGLPLGSTSTLDHPRISKELAARVQTEPVQHP